MNPPALIFTWFTLSLVISGCSEQDRSSNTEVTKDVKDVFASVVVSKRTITNVVEQQDTLERHLDNEPSLACQLSYETTAKAVNMQSVDQSLGVPTIKLARHDVFMKDCLGLPRRVQKCLVDQYAFKHIESCQQARKAYDRVRIN